MTSQDNMTNIVMNSMILLLLLLFSYS